MPTRLKPSPWTPRRRRGAAIQLLLGGVLLMGVPLLLGDSGVAAGFRMLAPVAWLMTVAGAVLLLFLRERDSRLQSAAPSGAVPLHPKPVRVRQAERRPLARPSVDPLDGFVDTESPPDERRRR